MGFFSNLGNSFAESAGSVGASILGGAVAGGGASGGDLERAYRKETNAYKNRDQYDWSMAQERGLTPQEFYGSSAAGGSAPSGGAQTLGNAANQQNVATRQIAADSFNKQKDREVALQGQETQKDIAKINAGVNIRGQDINKVVADNILNMDKRRLEEIELKKVAADLSIKGQELKYKLNQVATSDPKFITAMKQLSMGPANLLVELTMRHHGIALNNKSFMNLSKQQREEILQEILALSSSTYTEGKGAAALGGSSIEGANNLLEEVWSILKSPLGLHRPIEKTESNTLGKKFKPPKSYKRPGYPGPQPFKTY